MIAWLNALSTLHMLSYVLLALVVLFLARLPWVWIRNRRQNRTAMLAQATQDLCKASADLTAYVARTTVPAYVRSEFNQKRRDVEELLVSISEFIQWAEDGRKRSWITWLWVEINLQGSLWTLRRFPGTTLHAFTQEVTGLSQDWMKTVRARVEEVYTQAQAKVFAEETRYRALAPGYAFTLSLIAQEVERLDRVDACARDMPGPLSLKEQVLTYEAVSWAIAGLQAAVEQGLTRENHPLTSQPSATKMRWFFH